MSTPYELKPLSKEYLRIVLAWRNSERIHSKMLTDHKITWEEHSAWFERAKENNPIRNLILFYKDRPLGYLGYTEYDEERHTCSPGAYIGETENVPDDAGFSHLSNKLTGTF